MQELEQIFQKQIDFNRNKNIINSDLGQFKFTNQIRSLVKTQTFKSNIHKENIINFLTNQVMQEFCRVNQYYSFDSLAIKKLKGIYVDLWESLNESHIMSIEMKHYKNLKQWLIESNKFVKNIYSNKQNCVIPVACTEYSPELQIQLLQIDLNCLKEPILDIGCGKKGNLVNYFKERGLDSFGIDRFVISEANFNNTDWLKYEYGIEKWGTIISNLGFSNHFNHHHLRVDGNYVEYAKKYMEILKALKVGGKIYYAPSLSFIEPYLDKSEFFIEQKTIDQYAITVSIITKLK